MNHCDGEKMILVKGDAFLEIMKKKLDIFIVSQKCTQLFTSRVFTQILRNETRKYFYKVNGA